MSEAQTIALGLANPGRFYDTLRQTKVLGSVLTNAEVDGCEAILAACVGWGRAWTAYALGTAAHETARTMQPIREHGSDAYLAKYDTGRLALALGNTPEADGDGILYAGRGYVQLTGAANYRKAGLALSVPLLTHPELVLRPDIAAKILRQGMGAGWFTGRKLSDFLPSEGAAQRWQYQAARRIINGTDQADHIADLALDFETALSAGEWREPIQN